LGTEKNTSAEMNVFVSITYLKLRERARIAGVMDVKNILPLFWTFAASPFSEGLPARRHGEAGLPPNLATAMEHEPLFRVLCFSTAFPTL